MVPASSICCGNLLLTAHRCRVKKIRCDGLSPHCSSCLLVSLNCTTNNMLRRRAFPKNYTEHLEETIRALESNDAKLKETLDDAYNDIDWMSLMIMQLLNATEQFDMSYHWSPPAPRLDEAEEKGTGLLDRDQTCIFSIEDLETSGTVRTLTVGDSVPVFKHAVQESVMPDTDADAELRCFSKLPQILRYASKRNRKLAQITGYLAKMESARYTDHNTDTECIYYTKTSRKLGTSDGLCNCKPTNSSKK